MRLAANSPSPHQSKLQTRGTKQFEEKWIVTNFESAQLGQMAGWAFDAAFTKGGRIVVTLGKQPFGGLPVEVATDFRIFNSFDEFEAFGYPEDFVSAVAAELGEDYVEVLDI